MAHMALPTRNWAKVKELLCSATEYCKSFKNSDRNKKKRLVNILESLERARLLTYGYNVRKTVELKVYKGSVFYMCIYACRRTTTYVQLQVKKCAVIKLLSIFFCLTELACTRPACTCHSY